MKERPILFSGPMVRALLDGRKTQTRRIVKPQPPSLKGQKTAWASMEDLLASCPYGVPGDRLWVREATGIADHRGYQVLVYQADGAAYHILATEGGEGEEVGRGRPVRGVDAKTVTRWRPSIHMPRWACRLVLEVVSVRVERVQAIRHVAADLEAEGVVLPPSELYPHTNRASKLARLYEKLWGDINGKESWDANPWVRVVEFKKVAA